ncbi:BRO family, N-terminal domain [Tranquillimonas alkanivorans]|uniref:BRO family, N-terminal domain n=1 Tax=Tranquillimonas alkanivorans TaxID=441119 RepID=A0A1I5MMW4_9RHOB|nr:BRO family, N-terminal domain [Tranquillimonas alkanivorans]
MCEALDIRNPSNAVKHGCNPDHYPQVRKSEVSTRDTISLSFPNRGMLCVSEAGIYDLINQSRKPAAIAFRKWVNGTVLPRLRENGSYVVGEEKVEDGSATLDELELFHKAITTATSRIETLTEKLKQRTEKLTEARSAWPPRVSAALAEQARRWHEGHEGIRGLTMKTLATTIAIVLTAAPALAQDDEAMVPVIIKAPETDAAKLDHMRYGCVTNGGVLMMGANNRGVVFCVNMQALIPMPGEYPVMERED